MFKFTKKSTFSEYLEFKGLDALKMEEEEGTSAMNEFVQGLKDLLAAFESAGKATDESVEEVEEEVKAIKEQLKGIDLNVIKQTLLAVKEQGKFLATLKGAGSTKAVNKTLRSYIEENSEVLKEMRSNKSKRNAGFSFTTKATEVATDIGSRDYLGTIDPNIYTKPVRETSIIDLFPRRAVSGEYFHYWEQDVVTRDAKFVVACATSTHATKQTWSKRTVELAKIRDIIDICIDMLDDYSFVESSMRKLIDESIKLLADRELLLGVGVATTDLLSLNTVSSEFNAANALADFSALTGTPFQDANLEQLVDAMGAQISIFGEQNAWMANTLVMNYKDYVNYRNLKDAKGNKLIHTLSDAVATIAGMKVVTSPIVVANTCYVFDSSKGEILDRQAITVQTSYENKDNIEHELVTLVGVERLQFNVRNIERDAFMKCSDIATAISAILKP
tara:strand:- start:1872 stop:3212 length:1341 start_codon:yes stop_codon:yes gene_type:complete